MFGPFNCYGPLDDPAAVEHNVPGCIGRTMRLLWESVFLGGDRGRGFEQDLRAIGATPHFEELAESLHQARQLEFPLSEAGSRFVVIDEYCIEMLSFIADYDAIIRPLCRPWQTAPPPTGGDQRLLTSDGAQLEISREGVRGWQAPPSVAA